MGAHVLSVPQRRDRRRLPAHALMEIRRLDGEPGRAGDEPQITCGAERERALDNPGSADPFEHQALVLRRVPSGRIEKAVKVDDEIARHRAVHRLLGLRAPSPFGGRIVREDSHDVERVGVAERRAADAFQLAAEDEMQELLGFALVVLGHGLELAGCGLGE